VNNAGGFDEGHEAAQKVKGSHEIIHGVLCFAGFQKWGMTSYMVAAFLIRDTICKIPNSYAKVFSPQRIHFKAGFKHWITDFGVSTKGLFHGWLLRRTPRCSHMGCGLVWNQVEKTWECPCHGSRFDEEGKLLDNPSKKNLS
jgi:hypothetical protein